VSDKLEIRCRRKSVHHKRFGLPWSAIAQYQFPLGSRLRRHFNSLYFQAPEFVTLLNRLLEREELVFENDQGVDIDVDEIVFLVKNVWRAKSAFSDPGDSSMEKGLTRSLANLHFTR
jgi:hypothetical protein